MRRTAVLLALVMGLSLIPAAPAHATSVGCTRSRFSPSGFVCLTIRGTGTYVEGFRVGRTLDVGTEWICDYKAKLVITYPNGYTWSDVKRRTGCKLNHAYFDWWWGYNVPHGTKVCGKWWSERRTLADGKACNYVYRS